MRDAARLAAVTPAPLAAITLDCPDPAALASFYQGLVGGQIVHHGAEFVALTGPPVALGFQRSGGTAVRWPDPSGPLRTHLEFAVGDAERLDDLEERAVELGAHRPVEQPRPEAWRVLVDPAGHLLCLTTLTGTRAAPGTPVPVPVPVPDLHTGFARPSACAVSDRVRFLQAVDELPGLRPVRAALRRAVSAYEPRMVVDVGCGLGLETARLAADRPDTTVIGLDHDPDILAAAREHAPAPDNLSWRVGDACALDLAPSSVDLVRTDRVLMYVPSLDAAASSIRSVLRPGGVFTGFELDYGATVLPPLGLTPEQVGALAATLEDALPQPWAGRLLPEALHAVGMRVTDVEPFTFTVDGRVWSRIIADTLRGSRCPGGSLDDARLEAWLEDVDVHAFRAIVSGVCTTAHRP